LTGQIGKKKGTLGGIWAARFHRIGLQGFGALRQLLPAIQHSNNRAYYINKKRVELFLRDD